MGIISKLFSIKANSLQKEKHNLIRTFENKEITEDEYVTKMNTLEQNIKTEVNTTLDENKKKLESVSKEENIMAEEKPKEEKKKVEKKVEKKNIEKTLDKTSYTKLILKALAMKQTKTIDAVADKVLEWKPGKDKKKLANQARSVIKLVNKEPDATRWEGYKWNEESFLLEKPE